MFYNDKFYHDKFYPFSGWKEISIDLTVGYQINFSHLANPKALIQRATHFAFSNMYYTL